MMGFSMNVGVGSCAGTRALLLKCPTFIQLGKDCDGYS